MLPPTSPLRKKNDIDNAIKFFYKKRLDSCFSGSKLNDFLIWNYNKFKKRYKSINYDSLIGLLIEGIKQLDREVRLLRKKVK